MSADAKPLHRGGRVVGSEGYTKTDVQALLQCVRTLLPKDAFGWETVLLRYRETHARPNGRAERDALSLKKKFKSVLNTKQVDGGKPIPPEVVEARQIQALIDEVKAERRASRPRVASPRPRQQSSPADSEGDNEEDEESKRSDNSIIHPSVQPAQQMTAASDAVSSQPNPPAKRRRIDVDELQSVSSEGFLRWQLASEMSERQRLQQQVETLRDRMDQLRDSHRRELEASRAALLDKVDELRDRNVSLLLENGRLQNELLLRQSK